MQIPDLASAVLSDIKKKLVAVVINNLGIIIISIALSLVLSSVLIIYIENHTKEFVSIFSSINKSIVPNTLRSEFIINDSPPIENEQVTSILTQITNIHPNQIRAGAVYNGIWIGLILLIFGVFIHLSSKKGIFLKLIRSFSAFLLSFIFLYIYLNYFIKPSEAETFSTLYTGMIVCFTCTFLAMFAFFKALLIYFSIVVKDSKDRLTIVIATMGLIISLISVFK